MAVTTLTDFNGSEVCWEWRAVGIIQVSEETSTLGNMIAPPPSSQYRVRFLFMSCWPAKSLTRELESVTRQSRLGKHLQRWRLRLSNRLGEDLSGLTQLSRELVHGKYPGPGPTRSHQSGNHLTNRHCQPPPTCGLLFCLTG